MKRHKIFAADKFERLIYLERPLTEAVLSHGRDFSDFEFESHVRSLVGWWMELRKIYELWPETDKLLIRFEQIEAGDSETFFVLGNFLGIRRSRVERFLSRNGLSETFQILKRPATPASYSEKFPKRAKIVEAAVAEVTD